MIWFTTIPNNKQKLFKDNENMNTSVLISKNQF